MKKLYAALAAMFLSAAAVAQGPQDVISHNFYWVGLRAQVVNERFIPKQSIVFIGDSIIQNMDLSHLPTAVNFGISGDTSAGIAHRFGQYETLKTARAVVVEGGVNDLGFGSEFDTQIVANYRRMMSFVPRTTKIYMVGIFPINETRNASFAGYNDRIKSINKQIYSMCSRIARCKVVDIRPSIIGADGDVKQKLLRPTDAIHFNDKGNAVLLRAISKAMRAGGTM